MNSFTCISCRVLFKDNEIQRLHYKTDWHRYNLKRKVAELPPVSAEEFQRRVLSHREVDNTPTSSPHCTFCRKTFSTQNAFENHLNSKKHKENTAEKHSEISSVSELNNVSTSGSSNQVYNSSIPNAPIVDDDMEDDSDEWEVVAEEIYDVTCLFCTIISKSMVDNIKHMYGKHTFFIPDIEYCTDVEGLLNYLGNKIDYGFMCIWCNEKGRSFHSGEAARNHMLDKGHCKMLHEGVTLAEYAEYYDYSSSYPDHDAENTDRDSEVAVDELDDTDFQLVLPSGAVIGHRSLMRYYKQNIDPNRAVVLSRSTRKLNKILVGYHALGWKVADQEAVAKKARDLLYMKRMQNKYSMKLGVKGNKLQKHFRQQVNF